MPTRESLYALTPVERLAAVAAALPHMQVADLMPLVEALARSPGADPDPVDPLDYTYAPDWETPMLRALLARWVELDAPGLMALMDSPGFRHDYRTRSLAVFAYIEARGISAIGEMRNSSPTLAAAAAREMLARNPAQLDSLLPLLAALGGGDQMLDRMDLAPRLGPERFLRYVAAVGHSRSAGSTIREIRDAQGQAAALLLVKNLPPSNTREELLQGLLWDASNTTREGGPRGLDFCREYEALPPGRVRDNLLPRYAETLAAIDPPAALAWARALPRGPQRGTALDRISQSLPESTPPQEITRLLAESWLADPLAHKVESPLESGSTFPLLYWHGSVRDAFRVWHGQNPAEAAAWLETVTLPSLRSELVQVLMPAGQKSPADIPDSSARLEYAMDVLYNREALFTHPGVPAADLPPASIVPPELEAIAEREWNIKNGVPRAEWDASVEDLRALSEAALHRRLRLDAETAIQFFDSIAPEERSLGAYYQAGLARMRQDEEEASRWMESLPRGPGRDAAVTALVEQLSAPGPDRDGEAAFAWAASMSGEAERARFTAQAAEAWASADPAAARAAIQSAPLPAAEKQALLRRLPEGGPQ